MQSAQALSTPERSSFPVLPGDGRPVEAKRFVAAGTGLWVSLATLVAVVLILASFFTLLVLALIGMLVESLMQRRTMARIRGSHMAVGPAQLPEVDRCVKAFSQRLGLKEVPEIYVVEAAEINAFAVRIGARRSVLIVDDVIWGSVEAGLPDALRFILAHELAHHALGHMGTFRHMIKQSIPKLARLDELSADAVALQLVGTREAAYEGIMMLTVGPQLMKYTNRQELLRQASQVSEEKVVLKAERQLTHPLLLRRLHVLRQTQLG